MKKKHPMPGLSKRSGTGPTPQPLPEVVFSLTQLRLLRLTLQTLEQVARRQPKSLPKLDLAVDTIKTLQGKIDQMIAAGTGEVAAVLDGNETLMVQASIWIFSLSVETFAASPEKERLRTQCQTLSSLLLPSLQRAHLFN